MELQTQVVTYLQQVLYVTGNKATFIYWYAAKKRSNLMDFFKHLKPYFLFFYNDSLKTSEITMKQMKHDHTAQENYFTRKQVEVSPNTAEY